MASLKLQITWLGRFVADLTVYACSQASKDVVGQIFFNNEGIHGGFVEPASVHFSVIADGQHHTYKVYKKNGKFSCPTNFRKCNFF